MSTDDGAISVRFPIQLKRAIRVEAAKRDMSISEAMREAGELWLKMYSQTSEPIAIYESKAAYNVK